MAPRHAYLRSALLSALGGAAVAGACAGKELTEREQVREEVAADVPAECDEKQALKLYRRRIEPLFDDDRPSSCSQCHLSGLELGLYVQETPCETMACMADQGLINLKKPEQSLVLSWVERAQPDSDLITERVIAEEYEGLRQWIEYNVRCDACEDVTCPTAGDEEVTFCEGAPELAIDFDPESVDAGGCGPAAMETLFRDTVYAGRGRCSPCHFNNQEKADAPQWLDVKDDCQSAVSRTLRNLEQRGLIDTEEPEQSLLLLKPLPEKFGGVKHGGHDKFYSLDEDVGYLTFLYFLERYAACQTESPE